MLFHVQYRSEPQQVLFYTQEQQFYPYLRKKQNTVKTEEKHEQRNENCIGADNVCPRYADYGVSVLPAVMYA